MPGYLILKSSTILILLILSNAVAFGSENQETEKNSSSTLDRIEAGAESLVKDAKQETEKVRREVNSYGQKERQKLDQLSADALQDLGARAHYDLAVVNRFPSASQCADCHPRIPGMGGITPFLCSNQSHV